MKFRDYGPGMDTGETKWKRAVEANSTDPYSRAVIDYARDWADAMELKFKALDLAETAWGIIANAGGGDWHKESVVWQEAAAKWREEYHAALKHIPTVASVAQECEPKGRGITGFMYGAAVATLVECWAHGEALREWHNSNHGVPPEQPGVVNPALLSINLG